MDVMTKSQQALLDQLTRVAGDPRLVERALRALNAELGRPPRMEEVLRRLLQLRFKTEATDTAP